jgi:hypothetical protein
MRIPLARRRQPSNEKPAASDKKEKQDQSKAVHWFVSSLLILPLFRAAEGGAPFTETSMHSLNTAAMAIGAHCGAEREADAHAAAVAWRGRALKMKASPAPSPWMEMAAEAKRRASRTAACWH